MNIIYLVSLFFIIFFSIFFISIFNFIYIWNNIFKLEYLFFFPINLYEETWILFDFVRALQVQSTERGKWTVYLNHDAQCSMLFTWRSNPMPAPHMGLNFHRLRTFGKTDCFFDILNLSQPMEFFYRCGTQATTMC